MTDYQTLSEARLLELLKKTDPAAFTEIYNRYYRLCLAQAFKKVQDEEQAKDLVQELFTTLWQKRESCTVYSTLGAYMYAALRNRIFDLFARDHVKMKYLDALERFLLDHHGAATDARLIAGELEQQIEKEICALPPKMRRIFELSRKEHLSYQEIAAATNTSTNNISKQVNHALKILRVKIGMLGSLFF